MASRRAVRDRWSFTKELTWRDCTALSSLHLQHGTGWVWALPSYRQAQAPQPSHREVHREVLSHQLIHLHLPATNRCGYRGDLAMPHPGYLKTH